jgi:hypothetical protein
MADQLAGLGLSSEQLTRAQDSIGGAIQVAAELPGQAGQELVGIAKEQFVNGMGTALVVGIVVVLVAAAIVFAFLPARAHDPREAVEGPLDGIASLTFAEAESVLERDAAEAAGLLVPSEGGGHGRAEGSLGSPTVAAGLEPVDEVDVPS